MILILLRAFDSNVRNIHHVRSRPHVAKAISLENAHNLAEPVFADSAHSVLLQQADLVSYLLLQRDREALERTATPSKFRGVLLRIAATLRDDLVHSWRGEMKYIHR